LPPFISRLISFDTVRSRLRALALSLAALPLCLVAVFFYVILKDEIEVRTLASIDRTLGLQRLYLDNWMEDRLAEVTFLADLPQLRSFDDAAMAEVFASFRRSSSAFDALIYVEPDGHTRVDTSGNPGLYVGDRAYFDAARQGRSSVTGVLVSRKSGRLVIVVSAPVALLDGSFGGAVLGAVPLSAIEALMSRTRLGFSGETFLLDADGRLLTGYEESTAQATGPSGSGVLLARARQGEHSTAPYVNHLGRRVIGDFLWTKGDTWLLVGELPLREVFSPLNQGMLAVLGGLALSLAVLTPLFLRLARSLEEPLERLHKSAVAISAGRFAETVEPESLTQAPREIRDLNRAFRFMARRIHDDIKVLEESSRQDFLTGISNRRHLLEAGLRYLALSRRNEQDCACLMVDLDHFKAVNDTHGHSVGDEVLKHVVRVMLATIRGSDLLARFGGEEFAVIAANTTLADAASLAERMRQAVAAKPLTLKELCVPMTVSIGVALCPDLAGARGVPELEAGLKAADRALYQAKSQGRNRVVAWPEA